MASHASALFRRLASVASNDVSVLEATPRDARKASVVVSTQVDETAFVGASQDNRGPFHRRRPGRALAFVRAT